MKAVNLNPEFKIKCDILSKVEVFGASEESDAGQLDWFKEPKHKIAMYKNCSDWWWLSDYIKSYDEDDIASSASFAFVSGNGLAGFYNASVTDFYVRPRFVIERKA